MAYLRRMYYVPFLSAAYLFFNTYENKRLCSFLFMQFAHYSYQLSEVEDATGEI